MKYKTYTINQALSWTERPQCPFILNYDNHDIVIKNIFRLVPGKRLVAEATMNQQTLLLKCFLGKSAPRHFNREIEGIKAIKQAEILTPNIINQYKSDRFAYVASELLVHCQSLETIWNNELSDLQRQHWLTKTVQSIAKLHNNNTLHKDPHLDNFLIQDDQLYLIDGGGVAKSRYPLTHKNCFKNLALFLSVLFPKYDSIALKSFSSYLQFNPLKGYSEKQLAKVIHKERRGRKRYLEKIFRNCTDFIAESSFTHFQVIDRREDSKALRRFLEKPDLYINSGKVLKKGKTNTVSIVRLDDGNTIFVKRYKSTKGFVHKYLRGIRKSRARNAWYCAHFLIGLLGIDTPKPIALLEKKIGPLTQCSYLITEYVEAEDALSYFTRHNVITDEVRHQSIKIKNILNVLKNNFVFHGDMKATNFILTPKRMMIIDLDQTIVFSSNLLFKSKYKKDIKRFQKNWKKNLVAQQLFN